MRTFRALAVSLLVTASLGAAPARAATPTCFGREATIVGGGGARIRGTPGDDVIVARERDYLVHALGGDDLVCTGGRNDRIHGGAGDDRIRVGCRLGAAIVEAGPRGRPRERPLGTAVGGPG